MTDDSARTINTQDTLEGSGITDINIIVLGAMGHLNINLNPHAKPFLPQTPCTDTLIESMVASCSFTHLLSEDNKN